MVFFRLSLLHNPISYQYRRCSLITKWPYCLFMVQFENLKKGFEQFFIADNAIVVIVEKQ